MVPLKADRLCGSQARSPTASYACSPAAPLPHTPTSSQACGVGPQSASKSPTLLSNGVMGEGARKPTTLLSWCLMPQQANKPMAPRHSLRRRSDVAGCGRHRSAATRLHAQAGWQGYEVGPLVARELPASRAAFRPGPRAPTKPYQQIPSGLAQSLVSRREVAAGQRAAPVVPPSALRIHPPTG